MAWLKTIDGDLINLNNGMTVIHDRCEIDPDVRIKMPGERELIACSGDYCENKEYMNKFEAQLKQAGEIIIDPS